MAVSFSPDWQSATTVAVPRPAVEGGEQEPGGGEAPEPPATGGWRVGRIGFPTSEPE